jgi:hypothetical protein
MASTKPQTGVRRVEAISRDWRSFLKVRRLRASFIARTYAQLYLEPRRTTEYQRGVRLSSVRLDVL